MNKKAFIKYMIGLKMTNGVMIPVYQTKLEEVANVIRFNNCSHKMRKLSKLQHSLLHFLTEEMNEHDNVVHQSPYIKKQFNQLMKRSCNEVYDADSIKKAFVVLKQLDLIISTGRKGYYAVNPLHFCKCSKEQRKRMIIEMCRDYLLNPSPLSNLKRAFGI